MPRVVINLKILK
ncbi:hypothetical protein NADRNF5_2091 [Nitrosopumilus adriaticus]|uniref:Uncharacterized protein n=1 Tax=Nitrosopumilus adriaticus TaxID=1580092 RepID=A0A0D5C4L7_9ARCH|nr:hypothetical protein NADRNF5_2091 [Nitrosopumilus adriaticus]